MPKEVISNIPDKFGQLKTVLLYKFCRKEIASKTPFNAMSASPIKDKIQQISQELIRRFRNTSRELEVSHIEQVTTEFCADLKRGGFDDSTIRTWRTDHCGWPNCWPYQSKEGSCLKHNVLYKITCLTCKVQGHTSSYWGESHRSAWDRAEDHKAA